VSLLPEQSYQASLSISVYGDSEAVERKEAAIGCLQPSSVFLHRTPMDADCWSSLTALVGSWVNIRNQLGNAQL